MINLIVGKHPIINRLSSLFRKERLLDIPSNPVSMTLVTVAFFAAGKEIGCVIASSFSLWNNMV